MTGVEPIPPLRIEPVRPALPPQRRRRDEREDDASSGRGGHRQPQRDVPPDDPEPGHVDVRV
jgi:hypothetical protein